MIEVFEVCCCVRSFATVMVEVCGVLLCEVLRGGDDRGVRCAVCGRSFATVMIKVFEVCCWCEVLRNCDDRGV